MRSQRSIAAAIGFLVTVGFASVAPGTARAHCDTMDGPVVSAACAALEKNDVDRVLIWVKPADEAAIRDAFRRTAAVRGLNPEAKELADLWFFETLVRLHRAGEGAPFTGLKPAGLDLGPAIPAADQALASGDLAPLTRLLTEQVRARLDQRFKAARAARTYGPHDVAAGRAYIGSYVSFIHEVEAIWQAATRSAADEEDHAVSAAEGREQH